MIEDLTGRLISCRGAEPKAGPSSSLFQDRATGRLWQVSAVSPKVVGDSYVIDFYPNSNYGGVWAIIIQSLMWGIDSFNYRIFIKSITIANPNKLYLYAEKVSVGIEVGVYPVLGSWEELIITWNNKPAIGSLISSKVVNPSDVNTWIEFDVNGNRDVCIKALVEDSPVQRNARFYSSEDVTESLRPYFT